MFVYISYHSDQPIDQTSISGKKVSALSDAIEHMASQIWKILSGIIETRSECHE